LNQEVENFKSKLAEKEAVIAECQARAAKWESMLRNNELERKRDKIRLDQEKDRFEIERNRHVSEIEELRYQIQYVYESFTV
jgi:chromosome segregation ATPase